MRDYGKVHTCFWSSDSTRSMSEDARMLALYLLTCSHGTLAGVFRAPDGYICEDMQWTPKRVSETLDELLSKGFANRCETTKWVWIIKHLEWNPPENPNQRKSALKLAHQIPDQCVWKAGYMRECGELFGAEPPPKEPPPTNPSETLSQPVAVTVTVKEVNRFADFWSAYPKKKAKGDALKAWNKARINGEFDSVMAALELQKRSADWQKNGGEFIPFPATWLNGRRWEDEPTSGSTAPANQLFEGVV